MTARSVYIGFDPREAAAFAVARHSLRVHCSDPSIAVYGLVLPHLIESRLFTRPQERRDGIIWDLISGAPCATEFSISRFLLRELAPPTGWALFMDSDMLIRGDIAEVFDLCDPSKAIMCVKHDHRPEGVTKMDGQVQTTYGRKNWSSFFAVNCDHPANAALTVELVNTVPGRDLHQFCWIEDDNLIGGLPEEWNWLAGHSSTAIDPKNCHHTEGSPCLPGYEDAPYADEFRSVLADWAAV